MKDRDTIRAAQPPEPRRGSTAEMVDRIREQTNRRDYDETELALIRAGRDAEAKNRWHSRKEAPSGR